MATPLQEAGVAGGRSNARRLRRQAKVTVARPQKRGPVTTDRRHREAVAPHVLARQCDVEPPDQVWVGDLTEIGTPAGWGYLAVFLALESRTGGGWALSPRGDTAFGQDAWRMAVGRRQPAVGLIHPADRGSQ